MKIFLLILALCIAVAIIYTYKNTISWYVVTWLADTYAPKKTTEFPPDLFNKNAPSHEKPIVVIIPSYNNAQWCVRNLDSVCMQKYTNYRIIYINDVSSDNTGELVQNYINDYNLTHKIIFIDNHSRQGALANMYNAVHSCLHEEIILTLDGDDWLAHDNVLTTINATYQSPQVWMTYGQYQDYPLKRRGICEQIPEPIIKNNAYRSYKWVSSHPRTFYAWLFKRIHKKNLQDSHGIFFATNADLAVMFPLLEMAGAHARFIDEILYEYNITNPLNDYRVRAQDQHTVADLIRAMPRYEPLPDNAASPQMVGAATSSYKQKSA